MTRPGRSHIEELLLKFDPALRWWSVLTVAASSFVAAQVLGELNAKDFIQQMSSECGLPIFSRQFLSLIESLGLYGTGFAVLILVTAVVGFRVLRTEEARYRLLAVIYTIAWPVVFIGVTSFFLAAYALPYAKCAAAT